MQMIMLYYVDSLEQLMRAIMELEGVPFSSTDDPDDAIRMMEASASPCVLFTDNYKANRTIRATLTRVRANSALRGKVWIVGMDTQNPLTEVFLRAGLIDEWLSLPFPVEKIENLLDRARASARASAP
ncbi:MAG TPA: hypothetical protein VF808_10295 [Ktedonobacterales bacterium]